MADIRALKFKDDNLTTFHAVLVKAYKEAVKTGRIPKQDVAMYQKAMATGYSIKDPKTGRRLFPWRVLRRRVARRYRRATGHWQADWNIDWEAIYEWVLDNIVPILKLLLMILPFIIGNEND